MSECVVPGCKFPLEAESNNFCAFHNEPVERGKRLGAMPTHLSPAVAPDAWGWQWIERIKRLEREVQKLKNRRG